MAGGREFIALLGMEPTTKNDKCEGKENLANQSEWSKGLFISSKAIPLLDISYGTNGQNSFSYESTRISRHCRTNRVTRPRNNDSEGFKGFSRKGQTLANSIDKLARIHKTSANSSNPSICWRGVFEEESSDWETSRFSQKFFVGGLPSKIDEDTLKKVFKRFDEANIFWPKNCRSHRPHELGNAGYVYVVFGHESSVRNLLSACKQNTKDKNFFYSFSHWVNDSEQRAEVQIIPWLQSDLYYQKELHDDRDFRKTIFVGALHGTITARRLFKIMTELFGSVVSAEIDCDKYKYPIGSGKVIFSNKSSYLRAIDACFVGIKCDKFAKKIQIDPYLEETYCESCGLEIGTYFCRHLKCLSYLCKDCWNVVHCSDDEDHMPVTRNF